MDLEPEFLVQRTGRLSEREGVETEFDERDVRVEAVGLQSGQIREQLAKARDLRP